MVCFSSFASPLLGPCTAWEPSSCRIQVLPPPAGCPSRSSMTRAPRCHPAGGPYDPYPLFRLRRAAGDPAGPRRWCEQCERGIN